MAQESSPPSDATLRVPQTATLADATQRVPQEHSAEDTPSEGPFSPDQDATVLVGREDPTSDQDAEPPASVPLITPRHLPLGVVAPGTVLCGNCIVRETIRPHETTRPGLYDCDAPEGHVMVKISAAEHPPIEELWRRLPTLQHAGLLRTHRVELEHGFFTEVQEFCEGGTLDDCIPRDGKVPLAWETIERGVVASFLSGIAYLHANGIVHRDIKPKNLYLRKNGDKVALVIGDFDISSVIESDNTSRDTPRGAGTHYYMAPEAFPRFVDPSAGRAAAIVSPASDFYSFGVVLVEVLLGTTALHSGRWSDVYDFYMAGGRLEIPIELPARARELIQGILIRNRRTRWGIAEVRRWLQNETTDADRAKISEDTGYELVRRAARPYNVFKSSPTDIPSLARAMHDEPYLAEEELMSGDVLVNWLGELDVKLAREVRRDRETWRHYPHVAYMAASMRLDPTLPFTVSPGLTVTSLEELEIRVEEWVKAKKLDLAIVVNRPSLMKLEAWLRSKSDANLNAANAVADLRAAWWDKRQTAFLSPLDARVAWEELRWLIDPLRPFHMAPDVWVRTPAEVARLCYGHNADWHDGVPSLYRAAIERWQDGSLVAWLRQRARDQNGVVSPVVAQIESLRHKNQVAPEAMWEAVLRLLDPQLPPVKLRIAAGAMGQGLMVEWGETVSKRLAFEATTPGLPFGAWKLENAPAGLHIEPIEIHQRHGELLVRLNTRNGLEAGSVGRVQISLEAGGTCSLDSPLSFVYRVKLPDMQRNNFIRNGALIGAGLAGGCRLIAFVLTGPEWVAPDDRPNAQTGTATVPATTTPAASTDAVNATGQPLPPGTYLGAGIVLTLGIVVAFYVWLDAVRKYAQQ